MSGLKIGRGARSKGGCSAEEVNWVLEQADWKLGEASGDVNETQRDETRQPEGRRLWLEMLRHKLDPGYSSK